MISHDTKQSTTRNITKYIASLIQQTTQLKWWAMVSNNLCELFILQRQEVTDVTSTV